MFQVCVPATGKQEVNMPLGILKSEFNWKNLSLERVLSSFTMCLIVNAYCKYEKKAMLSISTQLYNLFY